ncbi:YegS/Rv2252/BmrU family lipid kinase [Sphingomonas lutea]|uniref:YegS/Rv2252/BmrU family lipid kinase n=1 Tax=Sphingomonas lutea TaxID=1045317 RepID=A0A7G9SK55_9SPHN|nr:YegS/Rv2252/BmrU family lipid kinase [Sphingomonas lutea]QNN68230.1 YegS/Rv2252/BmrU family lipid kinase [Sphingomonas lutea]
MPNTPLPKMAILIVNAASRRGAEVFDQVRDKLIAAGVELIDARAVKKPETLNDEVAAAIDRAPMVIVGGGDGTLSETIDEFLGKDTVFAFLPLGTANSFARTLGIPLDLDGAIDVIAHGSPRKVDLAAINGDYFLNNAALGLAPMVAETVPHGLKKSFGRLGYLLWAGWSAASFKAFRLKVEDGKKVRRFWATEARIANGRFHGGVELIENADLHSGEVVIQVVRGRSMFKLGWSYLSSALKLKSRGQQVCEIYGTKMRVSTRPRMRVSIDGELGPETPFEVSVRPDAVTVAGPTKAQDTSVTANPTEAAEPARAVQMQ